MQSKASIKTHPIHPALVVFPIAFFTGAFVTDVTALLLHKQVWWLFGKYLAGAGIIGAVLAAVAGTIDYIFTVPPASSAKKRAATHGMLNVLVTLCFVVSFFGRGPHPVWLFVGLETAAFILLCIAGWMGGTLVFRNQIGVVNRFANKGMLKEAKFRTVAGSAVEVAHVDELEKDQMKLLHIDGRRIVLARTEEGYVAFDDRCSHRGGSLAAGTLICGTVQCPWHGTQFDVKTGAVKTGPARDKINTYLLREKDGKVFLYS